MSEEARIEIDGCPHSRTTEPFCENALRMTSSKVALPFASSTGQPKPSSMDKTRSGGNPTISGRSRENGVRARANGPPSSYRASSWRARAAHVHRAAGIMTPYTHPKCSEDQNSLAAQVPGGCVSTVSIGQRTMPTVRPTSAPEFWTSALSSKCPAVWL
jgi:hypothetical protein